MQPHARARMPALLNCSSEFIVYIVQLASAVQGTMWCRLLETIEIPAV
jgi:hypothetical protein